jgi:hypothetical protein
VTEIPKTYLGDAVYAEYDGYYLVLTTEDGESITNRIYLEPEVLQALRAYDRKVCEESLRIRKLIEATEKETP